MDKSGLLLLVVLGLAGCSTYKSETNDSETQADAKKENAGAKQELLTGTAVLEGFLEAGPNEVEKRNSFFSFEKGKLLDTQSMTQLVPGSHGGEIEENLRSDAQLMERMRGMYDLFLDGTHGLVANAEEAGWEYGVGSGGIQDLGEVTPDQVSEVPEDGYVVMLQVFQVEAPAPRVAASPTLSQGHTYAVRTGTGKYALFYVKEIDNEKRTLKFDWFYQPDGSRRLKHHESAP